MRNFQKNMFLIKMQNKNLIHHEEFPLKQTVIKDGIKRWVIYNNKCYCC